MTDTTPAPEKLDNYILVEGGIVQNDPGLPVFDMDVISDFPVDGQIEEAIEVARQMHEHDRYALAGQIKRIEEYVKNYGGDYDVAELNKVLAS